MIEKEEHSIDARLMRAHLVIANAKEHKTIREAIAQYNYDEARFNEGLEMYNRAYKIHHRRQSAWGEQLRVTGELREKAAPQHSFQHSREADRLRNFYFKA